MDGADIRGGPTEMQDKFIAAVQAAAGKPIPIGFERDGPRAGGHGLAPQGGRHVARRRADRPDVPEVLERFPLGQAFVEGWRQVRTELRLTMSILGRLFAAPRA